jgi:CIC family chloride channel protein
MPRRLRAFVRAREIGIIALAAAVGAIAGLVVAAMSFAVSLLHTTFFGIPLNQHLSAVLSLAPIFALVPLVGGLVFGLVLVLVRQWRPDGEVDPIEANALRGGVMSLRGSLIVALQSIWSSGVGASVGLEAGYTQLASGVASWIGRLFQLRRKDQRIIIGCGAAAAIAGAFGAPLSGAFYGLELIIGSYAIVALAPVGVSALSGYLVSQALTPAALGIVTRMVGIVGGRDLIFASILGVISAFCGIALMRGVALWDQLLSRFRVPLFFRPVIGGLIVGLSAIVSPQILSSGHGALQLTASVERPLSIIAIVFVLKAIASLVSLGSGFRGGLFFASLLLGALGGQLFAAGVNSIWVGIDLNASLYSIVGMAALSVSVIGGPLTMAFIALETTGDFWLAPSVLCAVIISSQVTRELFGYSFATWRFHLRGENIRSAADVGWIRDMTVGRIMRQNAPIVSANTSITKFRQEFPLGSTNQVVAVDEDGRYAGIIFVSEVHGLEEPGVLTIATLLHHMDDVLLPQTNIREAAAAFDCVEAEALAVVDSVTTRLIVGILTEAHTLRRYAEESELRRREILGE